MLETTRRRFLLGLSATGAFAAIPLKLAAPASVLEQRGGEWVDLKDLPKSLFAELEARCVGPITLSDEPMDGFLSLDGLDVRALDVEVPYIDVTSLHSTAREFGITLARDIRMTFRGLISPELQTKFMDNEPIHGCLALPHGQFVSSDFLITEMRVGAEQAA